MDFKKKGGGVWGLVRGNHTPGRENSMKADRPIPCGAGTQACPQEETKAAGFIIQVLDRQ